MLEGQRYKGKKDIATGCVFLGLAILFLISTYQLTDHQLAQLSIRQFPLIVSWVIVLLSLLLMGKGFRALKSEGAPRERDTPRPQFKELILRPFVLRFAGVAALGVLYTRVFDHVGYLVATPGLLLGAMLLFGEKRWYRLVLIPIIVSFVLYHVFRTFFRVPLPIVGF